MIFNAIPVVGWAIIFIVYFFISIPFYFLWNWLAPIYFYWLPDVYLQMPFWHIVGLFWMMPMVKGMIFPSFAYPPNYYHKKDS